MKNDSHPPIIFFHKNYDPYIAFALWQARITNPRSPIILLGDRTNDLGFLGVRHVRFEEYPGRVGEFLAAYQHFSPHEIECERLCIERYFHIADFAEKENIGPFLYLDSDVLLLMDLAPLFQVWQEYDAAGTPGLYGTCYYHRPGLAGEFCDFILKRYQDLEQIRAWRTAWLNPPAGTSKAAVNDMVLSGLFAPRAGLRWLDLRQPRDGMAFNDNVLKNDNKGLITLFRDPNDSATYTEINGRLVRLACLHFGGWSKRYASAFVDWRWPLARCFFKPNYRRNLKKLIQHSWFGRRFRKTLPNLPPSFLDR